MRIKYKNFFFFYSGDSTYELCSGRNSGLFLTEMFNKEIFNKYLIKPYSLPDMTLGADATSENKRSKNSFSSFAERLKVNKIS